VPDLKAEIMSAINCASRENVSNTPDFILANYLLDCLTAFEKASNAREQWYGPLVETKISDNFWSLPSTLLAAFQILAEIFSDLKTSSSPLNLITLTNL